MVSYQIRWCKFERNQTTFLFSADWLCCFIRSDTDQAIKSKMASIGQLRLSPTYSKTSFKYLKKANT